MPGLFNKFIRLSALIRLILHLPIIQAVGPGFLISVLRHLRILCVIGGVLDELCSGKKFEEMFLVVPTYHQVNDRICRDARRSTEGGMAIEDLTEGVIQKRGV